MAIICFISPFVAINDGKNAIVSPMVLRASQAFAWLMLLAKLLLNQGQKIVASLYF